MYGETPVRKIALNELYKALIKERYKFFIICFLSATVSVVYALSLPNIYKSEALLVANSQDGGSSSLSNLVGQFGGIASIAGFNIKGSNLDKTGYALQVLQSREFLYDFIEKNNLKPLIFAVEKWNQESNELVFDTEIFDQESQSWVNRTVSGSEPTLHETYKVFRNELLEISNQVDVGTIRISINHFSPFVAKELLSKLIVSLNSRVKEQDMKDALSSISYLEDEIKKTSNASAQNMFFQLIEKQHHTLMLTRIRDDYVFKVIDKPVVAEKKESPKRALICVVGVLLGGVLSVMWTFISFFTKQEN